MHLFNLLPDAKLNNVDLDWPYDSSGNRDVTKGPVSWLGMIGERWMIREETAQKLSDTSKGFCGAGIYSLVRTLPTSTTALVVGAPVFWSDKKNRIVTPDIAATFLLPFAGVALNIPATKGNVVMILECGEVDGLFIATSTTKATPVINDIAILSYVSTNARWDVLADATARTWGTSRLDVGARVNAAVTANAKSRIILDRRNEIDFVNGVI